MVVLHNLHFTILLGDEHFQVQHLIFCDIIECLNGVLLSNRRREQILSRRKHERTSLPAPIARSFGPAVLSPSVVEASVQSPGACPSP